MTQHEGYYDRYWTPEGFRPPPNDNPFLQENIRRCVARGSVVADLGCGDAETIGSPLHGTAATYTGVDISASAVESATRRGIDVRRVIDIAETGLTSGSFDAVFIIEVLEHLFDPLAAVQEARRILKPGGELIVTVPNSAVWPRRVELTFRGRPNAMGDELSREQPWRDPHLRSFTVRSLEALLRHAEFAEVGVSGTEPVPGVRRVGPWLAVTRPTLFARRCTAIAVA